MFCQPPFQPNLQPTGLPSFGQHCGSGLPNYGQPCGFNANIPNQINGFPDIIGEGNIAYIISPDGSTHLIFYPTLQWPPQWRTFLPNPCVGNLNNLGVWFVRNIFNPIRPTAFPQPRQDLFNFHCPRISSDCCLELSPPGLPLKFHNDICTSTSDLQYFVPKQFNLFTRPVVCAAVQVACPVATSSTICDYEFTCNKPCNCTPAQPCNCPSKEKKTIKCMCYDKKSSSHMSIDSTRSKRGQHKRKPRKTKSKKSSHKCECAELSGFDKCKNSSSQMSIDPSTSICSHCKEKSHGVKVKCECKPSATDKSVTTYADQGIGCAPDIGRETQTCSDSATLVKASKASCNRMRHKAEIWKPKNCSCSYSSSSRSCSTSGTE